MPDIPNLTEMKPLTPENACTHPVTELLKDHVTNNVFEKPGPGGIGYNLRWCQACDRSWWEPAT